MSPRERHQKVIDQLSAWCLKGAITKDRALEIEAEVTQGYPDGSNDMADWILWNVAKNERLDG